MPKVAVLSCANYAWIESSRTMGENLASVIQYGGESHVHVPIDKKGFIASLNEATYCIIHTHGSAEGFFDHRADHNRPAIVSLRTVKSLPVFPKLRLAIITACSSASNAEENIAAAFSTKIAPNGLVIANRYDVFGADYDFGEKDGKNGWVGYQNGKLVLSEQDFPPRITMADGYRIFLERINPRG